MRFKTLALFILLGIFGIAFLPADGSEARMGLIKQTRQVDKSRAKIKPVQNITPLTTVPDLTGKGEGVAVGKTLEKAGLKTGDVAYDATPAGWQVRVVLRQNPAPGAKVPKDSRVNIVVTLGPPGGPSDVRVPNVIGLSLSEATVNLENAGLFADVLSASARPIPSNLVDRQNPAPDRTLRIGSRVALTSSSDVLVPNVVGLSEAGAMGAITAGGLRMGAVRRVVAGEGERAGAVNAQTPPTGRRVRQNSAVDVTLTVEAIVPRLNAMTERDARQLIQKMGLSVGEVTYREMPRYFREGVVDQAPPPLNAVRRRTPVNFTVGIFIPREIVFTSVQVMDDTDPVASGEIWVQATVNGTKHIVGGNLSIESGGFATLDFHIPLPPLPLPPPERWILLKVEARDDDTGFAWANVFETGDYDSLGVTEEVTFPRLPASDVRMNMYGKGTNTIAGAKFRVVFEIR